MKHIKTWAFAALFLSAAVVLPACGSDKDDDEPDVPSNPSTPSTSGTVKFYAEIPAMSEDGDLCNQDDYLLWVCAMESRYGSSVSLSSNPVFRGISYAWDRSERLFTPISTSIAKTDSQKFCYYVSTSPILSDAVLPVFKSFAYENQDDDEYFSFSDLLIGKTGAESQVVVNVNLRHVFSRLQIECEESMGVVSSITLKNVKTMGSVNLNTQVVSTDQTYLKDVKMHKVKGQFNVFEAIVPPQTFGTTDILAEIVTSTGQYTWTPSDSFTLKSNQYIEYTLRDSGGSGGNSGSGNAVGFSGSIIEWQDD